LFQAYNSWGDKEIDGNDSGFTGKMKNDILTKNILLGYNMGR
jgi:hypothetical protein